MLHGANLTLFDLHVSRSRRTRSGPAGRPRLRTPEHHRRPRPPTATTPQREPAANGARALARAVARERASPRLPAPRTPMRGRSRCTPACSRSIYCTSPDTLGAPGRWRPSVLIVGFDGDDQPARSWPRRMIQYVMQTEARSGAADRLYLRRNKEESLLSSPAAVWVTRIGVRRQLQKCLHTRRACARVRGACRSRSVLSG